MALDLSYDPGFAEDDFIQGKANKSAFKALKGWGEWHSKSALLIGPEGAGKSHLASIWALNAGAPIITVSQLDDALLASLPHGFRLCLDGVDASLSDDQQTALFHLINLLKSRGDGLLLTSRQHPNDWIVDLPDLRSRLRAIPAIELEQPDEGLLAQLLVKLFADRQLDIGPDIIGYILMRMERSGKFAHRLVQAVDREALAQQARITKPLVSRVLNELSA
jgi:chromosomal replication initiation ATPase DnaA